jgi:SAM-dependent methyltransferase
LKLNIGCGLEYKKGYVNIDAFDNTVADQIMSVTRLEFDDQSFSDVDCVQVLEHLGAAKSIYALSEIYRILEQGGCFLLETPDLVSSFKAFIKGNENSRKLIMNWIYGLDIPGMSHKYGFPEELLARMLQETGFTDIEIAHIKPKSIHPSLRATCRKSDSRIHEVVSKFRKILVEKGIVNLENQVEVIEKEVLIQKLIQIRLNAEPTLKDEHLKTIVVDSSVSSPKIGRVFLDCISSAELVAHSETRKYIEILEKLDSLNFVNVLMYVFSELPILPGQQGDSFTTAIKLGKQTVGKLLANDQSTIDELRNTSKKIQDFGYVDYFSSVGLEIVSNKKLALGLKAFGLGEIEKAVDLLHDAVRLNHDSIIAFWNLARLFALKQNREKMNQYYSTVRKLLILQNPKNYRDFVRIIEYERRSAEQEHTEVFSEPIYSY